MGRDSNRFQEGNNRDGSRFSILNNEGVLEDDMSSSNDERANISLTTRSNPLFIPPADNGRVSGTNPLSDPPDTGEHDLGNISDEYDDSDYTADSVEEEDVSLDSTGSLVEDEEMCVEQQVESPTQ
ncbi:hypothetical protein WN944_018998 [Citrus x changshan-huyou]|uniref:Uncharacterized protein n=1 Tax=Citrus x changshan-huyou TaxID=2935761 RepID=A0AAP0LXT2_9ROSI